MNQPQSSKCLKTTNDNNPKCRVTLVRFYSFFYGAVDHPGNCILWFSF